MAAIPFDYVIVGGGPAGRTLALRLVAGAPAPVSVALVDAGGADTVNPGRARGSLLRRGRTARLPPAVSVPQPGLNGRVLVLSDRSLAARVGLGGEPPGWGDPAWSIEGLPLWGDAGLPLDHGPRHGAAASAEEPAGPWPQACLEAAGQAGIPWVSCGDGPGPQAPWHFDPPATGGDETAHAARLPADARIEAWTGSRALRLLFDGKRAIGVEVARGDGSLESLDARREVILCAGALGNPHLLQVSGVGDGAAVQKAGIRFKHHLPGVGANLHDRLGFEFRHEMRGGVPLAAMAADGLSRLSPGTGRPEVQWRLACGLAGPRRPLWPWCRSSVVSLRFGLIRPASRGGLMAQGPDVRDPPRIDPGHLDDPDDMERMVQAYRQGRRLLEAPALADRLGRDLATAGVRGGLAEREAIRDLSGSLGHFAGTCRMGEDAMAVVDGDLKVHGLQGLRVVDASVLPALAGGRPEALSVWLAGHAAEAILADLR
jgi:choline dehydrogenase-like flavoprotein